MKTEQLKKEDLDIFYRIVDEHKLHLAMTSDKAYTAIGICCNYEYRNTWELIERNLTYLITILEDKSTELSTEIDLAYYATEYANSNIVYSGGLVEFFHDIVISELK